MAGADNQNQTFSIVARMETRDVEAGMKRIDSAAAKTREELKRTAQESKDAMGELDQAFGGVVGKIQQFASFGPIAMAAAAAAAGVTVAVKAINDSLKETDDRLREITARATANQQAVQQAGFGAGLSDTGRDRLQRITAGADTGLTQQQALGAFNAVASTLRPTTEQEERMTLQIASRGVRADALSEEERNRILGGAGGLVRQGGITDTQRATDIAALSIQRGGASNILEQSQRALATARMTAAGESPEQTAAGVLSLTEQAVVGGKVEGNAVARALTQVDRMRREGVPFTRDDGTLGNRMAGDLSFLGQGSGVDAIAQAIGLAQQGDPRGIQAVQSLFGAESSAAIIGGVDLEGFEAGRQAFMGAEGVLEGEQARRMADPVLGENVRRERTLRTGERARDMESANAARLGRLQADRDLEIESQGGGIVGLNEGVSRFARRTVSAFADDPIRARLDLEERANAQRNATQQVQTIRIEAQDGVDVFNGGGD